MKNYLILAVMLAITPLACSAYPIHAFKMNYDVDPRFGSMNDGLTMMRFESYETHGYRERHGYDREDVGMQDNDRFGYRWESRKDSWNDRYSDE